MGYDTAGRPKSGQAITARGDKNGSDGGNGGKDDKNDKPPPKSSGQGIAEAITGKCRRERQNPDVGTSPECQ